jgi:hypothetical protein
MPNLNFNEVRPVMAGLDSGKRTLMHNRYDTGKVYKRRPIFVGSGAAG